MKSISSATLWIIIFLVVILLFMNYANQEQPEKLDLIAWKAKADAGELESALDTGGRIEGEFWVDKAANNKRRYITEYLPGQEEKILDLVLRSQEGANPIPYSAKPKSVLLQTVLFSVLPVMLFVIVILFFMRQIQSSGNKAISFGKSKAKLVQEGQIKITFKDVAGVEEACEELKEIVEYLKDPKRFSRLGGKIPKGVLLVGPPGTGKTLLAKAIAGEANVPFFSISGSDFVEMFVGVGASRVRDLFDQAKKSRPCIIFIDEIDAVGRSRFAGIGGSHDEREQTLNQLLVEMDGFQDNEGVILIAATNRPDVLDPALLRPGRFDRQVMVGLPDLRGREQILGVHAKKVKLDPAVKLDKIAKVTPGFSGADLANLINEAALLAARAGDDLVRMEKLEEAKDRVMMGPERRSLVITDKEKLVIAYHEAGHAVVSRFTEGGGDEVHKVTIIPRGPALGVTWILPNEEKHNHSRQQIINQLHYLLGGRAAEEIKFGEFTTGAANDLERVTNLAHKMVCVYGMSERLGPRTFGEPSGHVFLGKEMTRERNYSEETATIIDEEIKRLIEDAYARTMETLKARRDVLDRVAEALVERETIDGEEFEMLVQGRPLPPPEPPTQTTQPHRPEESPQRASPKPKLDPLGSPRIQPSS